MITHAAIRQNGVTYSLPAPARHHDVIRYMVEEGFVVPPVVGEQGFLDGFGFFWNRREAALQAMACMQITDLRWPPYLYSEDLW